MARGTFGPAENLGNGVGGRSERRILVFVWDKGCVFMYNNRRCDVSMVDLPSNVIFLDTCSDTKSTPKRYKLTKAVSSKS